MSYLSRIGPKASSGAFVCSGSPANAAGGNVPALSRHVAMNAALPAQGEAHGRGGMAGSDRWQLRGGGSVTHRLDRAAHAWGAGDGTTAVSGLAACSAAVGRDGLPRPRPAVNHPNSRV